MASNNVDIGGGSTFDGTVQISMISTYESSSYNSSSGASVEGEQTTIRSHSTNGGAVFDSGRSSAMSNSGAMSFGGDTRRQQSDIAVRRFIINRVDPTASRSRMSMSSRPNMSGGMTLSSGVAQQLSEAGISDFKGDRQKEKLELQGLNERLASYIERNHFHVAEIQRLEAENEALRNRKCENLQPIRDRYESELTQARQVIDELTNHQGAAGAEVAELNERIICLEDIILTYKTQAEDYRKKVSSLDFQIGELEGELISLRMRMASRDDETDKQRELINKYQNQIRNLRANLFTETTAHIEFESLAQTKAEECSLYKDLLDQLELMKPEPIKIKGMDAAVFWQSQMKKAIRDIQTSCDEKVSLIQADCEANFQSQINIMQSSIATDNMMLTRYKDEVTKLRGQSSESKNEYRSLVTQIERLQLERNQFEAIKAEMAAQMDSMRVSFDSQLESKNMELTTVMEQLRLLKNVNFSMETEIACYMKMLEVEEKRYVIPLARSQSSRMRVQRRQKGAIGFSSIHHYGDNVVIENDSSQSNSGTVNLAGWKIQKKSNNTVLHEVILPAHELEAGASLTIWSKVAKDEKDLAAHEMLADVISFGVGNCVWYLYDDAGHEKAVLTASFMEPLHHQTSVSYDTKKTSNGPICFQNIDSDGENVIIENDSANDQTVNLAGWKLQMKVNDKTIHEVTLVDFDLAPGGSFTVWSKGAKHPASQLAQNEMVTDMHSFATGVCVWHLNDNNGEERASITRYVVGGKSVVQRDASSMNLTPDGLEVIEPALTSSRSQPLGLRDDTLPGRVQYGDTIQRENFQQLGQRDDTLPGRVQYDIIQQQNVQQLGQRDNTLPGRVQYETIQQQNVRLVGLRDDTLPPQRPY